MTRARRAVLGLLLVLGLAACSGSGGTATPRPSAATTASAAPASPGPPPTDWLAGLATDGTDLYLTSHSCPGQVAAGMCTIKGDFPATMKAYPVHVWRLADRGWEDLGEPGVFSWSDLRALLGALVLVPRTDSPSAGGGAVRGPLRVSADGGRTWVDWEIPLERRRCRSDVVGRGSGPCTVVVSGEHVVVASGFGWVRRSIRSADWEDITPPARVPVGDDDPGGYGVLALDDGTLIATTTSIDPASAGSYRVSRDVGSTWSAPRPNPGEHSQVDRAAGATLYASCWTIDSVSENGSSASGCGSYRSTDLVHWTKAPADEVSDEPGVSSGACRRVLRPPYPSWRETATAVRVGALVYAIANVPYVKGREATGATLPHLDAPHRAAHVLESSADGCRTWAEVLGATR